MGTDTKIQRTPLQAVCIGQVSVPVWSLQTSFLKGILFLLQMSISLFVAFLSRLGPTAIVMPFQHQNHVRRLCMEKHQKLHQQQL